MFSLATTQHSTVKDHARIELPTVRGEGNRSLKWRARWFSHFDDIEHICLSFAVKSSKFITFSRVEHVEPFLDELAENLQLKHLLQERLKGLRPRGDERVLGKRDFLALNRKERNENRNRNKKNLILNNLYRSEF